MKFADALAQSEKRPGTQCAIARLVTGLDDDDRAALQAAFDSDKVTSSTIARALVEMGFKIAPNTVSRHRRGDCRCD